jgi:DNA-binding NarL/FixJ family response regulator
MKEVVSRTPPIAAYPPGPVRVLVVSDDPLVRAGLGHLLESESEAEVVSDAAEAEVALWDAQHARLDELTRARGAGGGDRRRRVTFEPPRWRPARAARSCAAPTAPACGPPWSPCATAHRARRGLRAGAGGRPSRRASLAEELTAREREVLALLSRGLSNKQIAGELDISEHTAKFHVNAILGKLGAASRTEAVVVAVRTAWSRCRSGYSVASSPETNISG